MGNLNEMYRRYRGQVEFLLVYIREAHPTDGHQGPRNAREGIALESAKTLEQKEDYATLCVRKLDIEFPTLIDHMDNRVERDYTAFPDRLYLVDREGKIAYKSAPGPRGFRPPELESAIRKLLG